MAQRQNKPTPKSQKQISSEFVQPSDPTVGNPNNATTQSRGTKLSWREITQNHLQLVFKTLMSLLCITSKM